MPLVRQQHISAFGPWDAHKRGLHNKQRSQANIVKEACKTSLVLQSKPPGTPCLNGQVCDERQVVPEVLMTLGGWGPVMVEHLQSGLRCQPDWPESFRGKEPCHSLGSITHSSLAQGGAASVTGLDWHLLAVQVAA